MVPTSTKIADMYTDDVLMQWEDYNIDNLKTVVSQQSCCIYAARAEEFNMSCTRSERDRAMSKVLRMTDSTLSWPLLMVDMAHNILTERAVAERVGDVRKAEADATTCREAFEDYLAGRTD